MATSVTMTYGSYNFSPVPSFTYGRSAERTPGMDFCLSNPINIELNGLIVPTGVYGSLSGGFENVTNEVIATTTRFAYRSVIWF